MTRDGLSSGKGTSASNDVADPHPDTEEHYERKPHPGGANPPDKDIGPNSHAHDGTPKPKPRNVDTER